MDKQQQTKHRQIQIELQLRCVLLQSFSMSRPDILEQCYKLHFGFRPYRDFSDEKDFEECKGLAEWCVRKRKTIVGLPTLAFTWGYCMTTVQAIMQSILEPIPYPVAMADLAERMTPLMETLKICPEDPDCQSQYCEGGTCALKGTCFEGFAVYKPSQKDADAPDNRSSFATSPGGSRATTQDTSVSDGEISGAASFLSQSS